jgi:Cupin
MFLDQLILLASTFLLTAIILSYIFFRNPTSTMLIPCCIGLVLTTLLTPSLAIDRVADQAKSNQIKMAITHLDMFNALADSEFVYDFNIVTSTPFQPGSVLNANAATWPIMGSGQMTVAQLNLGPCAMLAPHLHPRATNVVISVVGQTRTYMRSENGAIDRQTVLTPGKMTIFPRASMHSMINEGTHSSPLRPPSTY